MSTSPIVSSNLPINSTSEEPSNKPQLEPSTNLSAQQPTDDPTLQVNKTPAVHHAPPTSSSVATSETGVASTEEKAEIPIHHLHHEEQQTKASSSKESHSTAPVTASSSSGTGHHQITPTTTMVSVVTEETNEENQDLLRSDYGNKSFYHLNGLNDEPLANYCKHYGESTEGNKYAKLARLITHFPNFNRKGMERFNLEALKEMCLELGLSTEGKKSFLIDRLFNVYLEKHKDDKLEFTFDTSKTTETEVSSDIQVQHHHSHDEEEEEEDAVNPKTGEPFRKSPRVAKRKQTEKETASKKVKSDESITREYFMKHADDLNFEVDGKEHVALKKSETHNSFGWHYSGRSKIDVGSHSVPVTVTLNVTVNKSGRKESEED